MTTAACDVLQAFNSLSPTDQHQVAVEILRREAATGDLSEAALHDLAVELFRGYDAEEAARADS
jgi:hypothetical protein